MPQESRLYTRSTYLGVTGSRTEERVQMGMRAWQRQPDGSWLPQAAATGIEDQLRPYLPQIALAVSPQIQDAGSTQVMRWYDTARDADLVLTAVTATGQPQQLVQRARSVSLTLSVAYTGWNTPVTIPSVPGA